MKQFFLFVILLLSTSGFAQSAGPTVDVKANGTDIRDVLYQLFTQSKKSYVLQPGIRMSLDLNLVNVDFDEALQIICEAASLKADLQNGIYYIGRKTVIKPFLTAKAPMKVAPVGANPLKPSVLDRKVTTKLVKVPLKTVLAEFTRQTKVNFEVDPLVPAYKLDAFLSKLTLRQALDRITKATNLCYEFTDHRTIRVYRAGQTPVD